MFFKKFLFTLFFISSFFLMQAHADNASSSLAKEDMVIDVVTNRGTIKFALFKQKEPELVNFFLKYVNSGFYNNLIFHRIIDGFVLQGGAYDAKFIAKEVQLKSQVSFERSEFKNSAGTLALIMRKDNSAMTSPQFFINLADNSYLDLSEGNFKYNVIGKIISGMEVVEKIVRTKVGQREGMYNVPFYPNEALIKEITVEKT